MPQTNYSTVNGGVQLRNLKGTKSSVCLRFRFSCRVIFSFPSKTCKLLLLISNSKIKSSFQMHSDLMDFEVTKNMTFIYLFEFINKIHMKFVLAVQTNHGVMIFRRQSTHFQYGAQNCVAVSHRGRWATSSRVR